MNLDHSNWHPDCINKSVNPGPGGTLYITCYDCGVTAQLEQVSAKVSAVDVCKVGVADRVSKGTQIFGLDKGGVK